MAMVKKAIGIKEQELAEEIGLTDKSDRRVKDTGKPEKTDAHCVVEGCMEVKAPGQTHVCTQHIRTN